MRGAQVAELPFTPDGWKHEPLRLIVRRVPVTAAELLAGSPKARRRKTIPPEQLQMVLDRQLDSTFAYRIIVTDIPAGAKTAVEVEHFHRQRAQIKERFKDAKLGQALRHLPSGKLAANRVWLQRHPPRRGRAPRPITRPAGRPDHHHPQHHPARRPHTRPPTHHARPLAAQRPPLNNHTPSRPPSTRRRVTPSNQSTAPNTTHTHRIRSEGPR
jgi:hypothetical protein